MLAETSAVLHADPFLCALPAACALVCVQARLYRGKGGELMRAAVCSLIGGSANARLGLSKRSFEGHLSTLDEALRHPSTDVRAAAAASLPTFCERRLLDDSRAIKLQAGREIAEKFVGMVKEQNVAARRGGALALSALPAELLAVCGELVLHTVGAACHLEEDADERDAESRAAAARSAATLAAALPSLTASACALMDDLLVAMEDYSIDNRGDVGSWVRQAALVSLESLAQQLLRANELSDELALRCLGSLARQAAGRIDRLRASAAERLVALAVALASHAGNQRVCDAAAVAAKLLELLPDRGEGVQWSAPAAAFPAITRVLAVDALRPMLLEGVLASAGGAGDSLGSAARATLAEQMLGAGDDLRSAVAHECAAILERGGGPAKSAAAAMRAVEGLLAKGALHAASPAGADAAWSARVAAAVKAECTGTRDVPKLMAAVTVLCALVGHRAATKGAEAPAPDELAASRQAFRQLSALLVNRFPRVRRHTAEQLYSRLLCVEPVDLGVEEGDLDEAVDMLGDTRWDGEVEAVRSTRDSLCAKLKVEPPKRKAKAAGAAARPKEVDHAYAALVNEVGY